jgi:hypothetical protein
MSIDAMSSDATIKDRRPTKQIKRETLKNIPSPPYSCMKHGTKPTYRQWMKTLKGDGTNRPCLNINIPTVPILDRSIKLKGIQNKIRMIKYKQLTKTIKHSLGKSGKTVSILIKSSNTRKNIDAEKTILKQTSIHEIKKYLRDKNLIKIGSKGSNSLLREMYEQSVLTGDIINSNSDNIVHNFLHEENGLKK